MFVFRVFKMVFERIALNYVLAEKIISLYNILCFLLFSCSALHAQGEVQICNNVHPPFPRTTQDNCTLVCSLKFIQVVPSLHMDEFTLCVKNTSLAVFCTTHMDCRQYHVGAYCKGIPCLCRKSGQRESYIVDFAYGIHNINTCVVSAKYVNPDIPIVPFPWKTLLYVCGIVLAFAAFLIFVRWLTPVIRSMQAKRSRNSNRQRQGSAPEDNANLFTGTSQPSDSTTLTCYYPQGLPRIYRASPRHSQRSHRSAASRARYISCAQADGTGTLSSTPSNDDKPPPYETAVQLPPPAYEDVERAINERRPSNIRIVTDIREIPATVPPYLDRAATIS